MSNDNEKLLPQELMKERKQFFVDAVRQKKKPKKVPNLSNTYTWKICDSPYKFSEVLYDYDKMFEVECAHHEKYDFDLYASHGGRNTPAFGDQFGKGHGYVISDENYVIQCLDSRSLVSEEEYPILLEKGLDKYYFENCLARKYGLTDTQDAISRFVPAAKERLKINEYLKKTSKHFKEVYGLPDRSVFGPEFPCDTLFQTIRGMKGFSVDLRRNTYYMEQALEMIDDYYFPALKKRIESAKEEDSVVFSGGRGVSMVHTVLNPKQFEKYHWPFIKRYVDLVAENDLTCGMFMEGRIDMFFDYLQDLPKGHVSLQIEQTDAALAKKKLPNLTITGGFPVHFLGNVSVQETLDKAKEVVDTLAYDGNFIFCTDKMLSYPNDAKSENLLALNNFLKECKF